jgi:hypothetical protein
MIEIKSAVGQAVSTDDRLTETQRVSRFFGSKRSTGKSTPEPLVIPGVEQLALGYVARLSRRIKDR